MKGLFLLLLFPIGLTAHGQSADFISVHKWNGRIAKNFYTGSTIHLVTNDGIQMHGQVKAIRNDSVYLTIYDTRYFPTIWGTRQLDTVAIIETGLRFKDISRIYIGNKHGFFTRIIGPLMMIGGGSYLALNLLNAGILSQSFSDKRNLRKLSIAGGVLLTGYILNKLFYSDGFTNRKYRIIYVNLSREPHA
jgi:hypothetical protein